MMCMFRSVAISAIRRLFYLWQLTVERRSYVNKSLSVMGAWLKLNHDELGDMISEVGEM